VAITQSDLDQLRKEFDAKLARVTIESMNSATAIGAYGERFNAMDSRFSSLEAQMDTRFSDIDRRLDRIDGRSDRLEAKLDNRFGWQTVMFTTLGILTLFGDAIRGAIGL
jgi:hypothetical protein